MIRNIERPSQASRTAALLGSSVSQQLPDPGSSSDAYIDDMALATVLAQTVRALPYVAALSSGRYGVAATYGPGQRIAGIVLHRPMLADDAMSPSTVEAHIVLAAAAVVRAFDDLQVSSAAAKASESYPEQPLLLQTADEIRAALARVLRRLRPAEPWVVDVTLDDLRDDLAPEEEHHVR